MKIIPVVDYRQGNVVLAVKGQRETYKPVTQGLFATPSLDCAINTFITFANCVYIADLDSIIDKKIDFMFWTNFFMSYPDTQFWLDIGSKVEQWSLFMHSAKNVRPIVGSESFSTNEELCTILQNLASFKPLLSIESMGDKMLGPADLISSIQHWPKDLIYLQLQRVGSATGPDFRWLQANAETLKDFNIYIGGGIRNIQDIQDMQQYNIAGVLLANSLHSGAINKEQIKKFS
jgi:phosphoribosylformimino-5-aminoimidazole carboxamide ribotide isomerase